MTSACPASCRYRVGNDVRFLYHPLSHLPAFVLDALVLLPNKVLPVAALASKTATKAVGQFVGE